ncbi:MAG: leucine-rich repeat protein [Spirochaetales bacterium]|nr:leucine-rich repeat protein [Spirochaetales bacterium]
MSDAENYKFVFSENDKKLKLYIRKFDSEVKENQKIDLTSYDKLETITESSFANEPDISEIKMPSSLQTIEKEAFKNCRSLKVVQFEGNENSELTIQFNVFKDCEKLDFVNNYGNVVL